MMRVLPSWYWRYIYTYNSYLILFYLIFLFLSYLILSYLILSYLFFSYLIFSYLILFTWHYLISGQYKIPLMVGVAGSVDPPAQILLCCNCVGPHIELDQAEVGNIKQYYPSLFIIILQIHSVTYQSMEL